MFSQRQMRTRMLLGDEGINNLAAATVMVIGLGAVGGYALEALARSGVGHLILVDFDTFDETNINRQILALGSTIGRRKTEVAAERVHDINPDCKVDIRDMFVNEETLPQLVALRPDFVVDAIDSLNSKCNLMETLWREHIPFISSMGAALKRDPSAIRLAKLSQTENCSLARMVRQRLRRRGVNLADISCVYSRESAALPPTALAEQEGQRRHIMGSLPTITAIFGLTIANQVILQLAGTDFKA